MAILIVEIQRVKPTLCHIQEPIREGHCTDLLLPIAVWAPAS